MAIDPRKFTVINKCEPAKQDSIRIDSEKKGFFDALGKIGDLEVLNDIGGSSIGQGLRTLKSLSDSVRNGEGQNSGFLGIGGIVGGAIKTAEQGANEVLGAVGINPNIIEKVANFNTGVANRGFGAAKRVFERVTNGELEFDDLPEIFQDIQQLDQFAKKIFPGEPGKEALREICGSKPYAVDYTTSFSPKYKFLFVVQFIFNDFFVDDMSDEASKMAFVVRTTTRPNINYEYEEANYYNFRTKYAKRSEYQPMTMTFMDDNSNQTMQFFKKYTEIMIPRSKIGLEGSALYEELSMNFDAKEGVLNSSSIQPVPDDQKSILKNIRLFHIWGFGRYLNVYNFINPKLTEMQLDDLDMASSDISEMQMQFIYDGLQMRTNINGNFISMDNKQSTGKEFDIEELTNSGLYPLTYVGPPTSDNNTELYVAGKSTDLSPNLQKQPLITLDDLDLAGFNIADFSRTFDSLLAEGQELTNTVLSEAKTAAQGIISKTGDFFDFG